MRGARPCADTRERDGTPIDRGGYSRFNLWGDVLGVGTGVAGLAGVDPSASCNVIQRLVSTNQHHDKNTRLVVTNIDRLVTTNLPMTDTKKPGTWPGLGTAGTGLMRPRLFPLYTKTF